MSDVIVLCYHAVSEHWPCELAVMPARMERQLSHLVKRGYRGDTFTAVVTSTPSQPTVVVTFDDAYRSVSEVAAPILARLGLPATVFVPTAYMGTEQPMSWRGIEQWSTGPWAQELMPMNQSELRRLSDAGWEIGSHSHTHARLTEVDDDTLRSELERSRAICGELLGTPCESIAYPYGAYDARVMRAAEQLGYRAGGTLPRRLHAPLALSWPRVHISREDDDLRFRLKMYPAMRWLRSTPMWRSGDSARDLRAENGGTSSTTDERQH